MAWFSLARISQLRASVSHDGNVGQRRGRRTGILPGGLFAVLWIAAGAASQARADAPVLASAPGELRFALESSTVRAYGVAQPAVRFATMPSSVAVLPAAALNYSSILGNSPLRSGLTFDFSANGGRIELPRVAARAASLAPTGMPLSSPPQERPAVRAMPPQLSGHGGLFSAFLLATCLVVGCVLLRLAARSERTPARLKTGLSKFADSVDACFSVVVEELTCHILSLLLVISVVERRSSALVRRLFAVLWRSARRFLSGGSWRRAMQMVGDAPLQLLQALIQWQQLSTSMRRRRIHSFFQRVSVAAAIAATVVSGTPAFAANLTWDNSGSATVGTDGAGVWNNLGNTNWVTGGVNQQWDNTLIDNAIFGSGGAGGLVTLGSNITAGTLTFNATSGGTYTISPTTAEILTINGGIFANETAAITANITLGGSQSWTTAIGKTLTVGGNVTNGANLLTLDGAGNTVISGIIGNGAGGLTQSGAGTVALSGINTYSGTTTVSSGILRATTSASALGTGALSLGGGDLQLANDIGLAFGRNTTLTGTATITSDTLTSVAGVTHTLGTLSTGANTLNIVKGANVASGTAGLTFGATTIAGGATFDTGVDTLLTLGALQTAGSFTKQGVGISL